MANDRRQYIRKQIDVREKNPNKLWATVSNILHRKAMPFMPDSTDPPLCASFSTFFVDKIEKIDWSSALITEKPNLFHLLK